MYCSESHDHCKYFLSCDIISGRCKKMKTIIERRTSTGKIFESWGKSTNMLLGNLCNKRDLIEGKHHTTTGGRTQAWLPIMYRVQFHNQNDIFPLCSYVVRTLLWSKTPGTTFLLWAKKATDPRNDLCPWQQCKIHRFIVLFQAYSNEFLVPQTIGLLVALKTFPKLPV